MLSPLASQVRCGARPPRLLPTSLSTHPSLQSARPDQPAAPEAAPSSLQILGGAPPEFYQGQVMIHV
jgi:hypothetical protein